MLRANLDMMEAEYQKALAALAAERQQKVQEQADAAAAAAEVDHYLESESPLRLTKQRASRLSVEPPPTPVRNRPVPEPVHACVIPQKLAAQAEEPGSGGGGGDGGGGGRSSSSAPAEAELLAKIEGIRNSPAGKFYNEVQLRKAAQMALKQVVVADNAAGWADFWAKGKGVSAPTSEQANIAMLTTRFVIVLAVLFRTP